MLSIIQFNNHMWGQVTAIALLLLGFYLFFSFINDSRQQEQGESDAYPYHLGCYDISNPLNQSKVIQDYLSALHQQLNNSSVNSVLQISTQLQRNSVKIESVNDIASQFQQYIISYQNIKSRNQYEQNFNNGLRKARDQFFQCRENFNTSLWDCKGTEERLKVTEKDFEAIKLDLQTKINLKYEHQNKIDNFLRDETMISDEEYTQKYKKQMQQLNIERARKQQQMKISRDNLNIVISTLLQRQTKFNDSKKFLDECKRNKKQIDYCKNISENINNIDHGINITQIHRKIIKKRQILQRQKSALAKTRKLNQDITQISKNMNKNKRELEQLEDIYNQYMNMTLCGGQLSFKCSNDNIRQLEKNITDLKMQIDKLQNIKLEMMHDNMVLDGYINTIKKRIKDLDDDLEAQVGSFKSLAHTQQQQVERLRIFRETLNNINKNILQLKAELANIKYRRDQEHRNVDRVLSRVGEIEDCLGKKQFFLKLQSRKPKNAEEDEVLKRKVAASLIAAINKIRLQ